MEHLLYITDLTARGLLIVTPSYASNNSIKPFKINITISNDKKFDNDLYNSMTFNKAKDLIKEAAENLQPQFSVIGHLQKVTSSLNLLFLKGNFPIIDKVVEEGKVCPPKNETDVHNGKQLKSIIFS